MIEQINPYELNIQGTIEVRSVDKSTSQVVPTWSTAYANVWMKRLNPPRGRESDEAMQSVAVQVDSFLIREEGNTITAKDHRIVIGSEKFYITGDRPYMSSLNFKILDTEKRDNQ